MSVEGGKKQCRVRGGVGVTIFVLIISRILYENTYSVVPKCEMLGDGNQWPLKRSKLVKGSRLIDYRVLVSCYPNIRISEHPSIRI